MHRLLLALWLSCAVWLHAATGFFDTNGSTLPLSIQQAQKHKDAARTDAGMEQSVFTMHVTPTGRHLYSTLYAKPDRLLRGEIFAVTLRSIVTANDYKTLGYRFSGGEGVRLLGKEPERTIHDRTLYDTFYFKATGRRVVLPDITPYLNFGLSYAADAPIIRGTTVNTTVLNPPKDFCGVLADRLTITHTKTTVYDKAHNILVFMADANRSDLRDFKLQSVPQQNFESTVTGPHASSMTYYAVLPNTVETLRFSYFNLQTQQYEPVRIPIDVDEDMVSTMSDLKPVEHGHDYQKAILFSAAALVLLLAALWKRSLFLLLIALAAGAYAAWLSIPLRDVCIKKGTPIFLLPMRNATIFEITPVQYELQKQGHIKGFTKVRLLNNKIGWVKDEDTCTP
ncbi:MAG TPA: hypothetical protein ENL04_00765 [Sulfuricurvum sp.]|nr:hypothetical protein [Sulfuricurvum sp.]